MATTTPNFGWTVPTSSDLVKNGATAIETLGDGIDASLVDLKGGTTGQVLTKASNTDMDFSWVADATGIPATIFDAKGDIIAATAADTASRLAVGTNGQVLTADSTAATGLKWATASSGSTFAGCLLYKTTSTTITNASNTTLAFDGEVYDTDGFHSTSSNTSRITIPSGKGGYYAFYGTAGDDNIAGTFLLLIMRLFKNGSTNIQITSDRQSANDKVAQFYIVVNAAAGDYFEFNLATYMSTNNALELASASDLWQSFGCHYLGA